YIKPVAVGAIAFIVGVNLFGIRAGSIVQNIFTVLKLAAIALLVVVGLVLAHGHLGLVLATDTAHPVPSGAFLGALLPVRMTVIRLPNGDLLLHSPTQFTFRLKEALEAIGPIRHLVAPNTTHWMFLRDWQRACPQATTWAAPGLRDRRQVQRSGLRLDRDLPDGSPPEWDGAITLLTVPGGLGFHEVGLFHPASSTLVLTDLVLNLEEPKVPALFRPVLRLFGSMAPEGMPPPYLRAAVKLRRQPAAEAALRLLALRPERVIFAHGKWFERDGTDRLRRSWRWLLGAQAA
ncbi:MAG TPA: DUF4336 domain-containing protein, partial [Rhodopila sp.]|nr:DUF4336 domain-containing protein [Rhodopila sp.]